MMRWHCYRILIASIMEEYNNASWEELIKRCEDSGVDAFEVMSSVCLPLANSRSRSSQLH